jgi:hypothetical protein
MICQEARNTMQTMPSQPSHARTVWVQIARWTLAAFLILLAPCFFLLGIILLVSWTAEPQPPSAGTVKLIMTLGFVSLALSPCSLVGAGFVIWYFRKRKISPPVI